MIVPVPLESLLTREDDGSRIVAFRADTMIDVSAFRREVAAWSSAFGAAPGRDWALFFEDSLEFAAALFGAWHAGKRVFLPSDALPGTIERLGREVDGFAGEFPGVTVLAKASSDGALPLQPLDRDAEALVVYTSGSSGDPVSIPKRLGQLCAEVETQVGLWSDMLEGAVIQATVSHQHIYGLLFRILLPLAASRPFAAGRLLYPEDMIAALQAGDGMVLVASPAHLKRLPDALPWGKVRGRLRGVFSSGGPLTDEALAACCACFGQSPVEVYGSSETGGIAWRRRSSQEDRRWRLLPGVELRQQEGETQVRSPYLPDREWFALSDKVQIGEREGEFELLGRADRIVKIEEKRVSLTAIERALCASELVTDARVLALGGDRVVLGAVIVLAEAGWAIYRDEGKRALNTRLRARLAHDAEACVLPRRWRYVWALPVNAQGKTPEQSLAALFDPRRPQVCLLSRAENEAVLRIDIDADSPFFDGHFPQAPILPGVTQIQWAIDFGRELFPLPPSFLQMENVKFQQVIRPGMSVELMLGFDAGRGALNFRLASEAGAHASGRIVFGEAA